MVSGKAIPDRHGAPDDPRMLAAIEHDGVADQVAVEEPLEIRVGGSRSR